MPREWLFLLILPTGFFHYFIQLSLFILVPIFDLGQDFLTLKLNYIFLLNFIFSNPAQPVRESFVRLENRRFFG